MFSVQAALVGGDAALRPGMAVRVRLLVEQLPDAILLPQEAVVRQGTRYVVYVLDEQGHAQPRPLTLGEFFVDGVRVESGVAAGERVVVSGQQKLQPGSPVEARPWEPTRNPNVELGRYGPADCEPS
jgi:multidrug efflux pump subunit AcrA (membrane-fusion protein)